MSSKITIPKICTFCKEGFVAKTTVTKFCSHKCACRAYKLRERDAKLEKVQKTEYFNSVGIDMKHIQTKEFLSIKETCLLLGISRMSLYRYIKSGNILSLQLGGRVIIKRAILDSLLNK